MARSSCECRLVVRCVYRQRIGHHPKEFAQNQRANSPRDSIDQIVESPLAERARFELAEEREPLAGLANRCLGPLDYLSKTSGGMVSLDGVLVNWEQVTPRWSHPFLWKVAPMGGANF